MSRLFHIKNELITKTPMTKNSRCFIKMEMGKLISGTKKDVFKIFSCNHNYSDLIS